MANDVAIIFPIGIEDEWRARAFDWVQRWYTEHIPGIQIIGRSPDPWSKGAAIADAVSQIPDSVEILILADADSFLWNPADLTRAVEMVRSGRSAWIVPHERVYRLKQAETERLHDDPKARARLGHTCRPVYIGPAGGGITVLSVDAYRTVNGVDPRFEGWGGEDVAFGWALETLVAPITRLDAALVHLWHPHPAPTLRGSADSEALVALYQAARGVPRRMTALVAGEMWNPLPPLDTPIRFRMIAARSTLRLASGAIVRFIQGTYETRDLDEVEQIRRHVGRTVREERTA